MLTLTGSFSNPPSASAQTDGSFASRPRFPKQIVPGQRYPPGVEILRQGAVPEDVWILDEGVVKLVHIAEDGHEAVVGLRRVGWILGASAAIIARPNAVAAITLTACDVQRLDARTFLEMLVTDPQLSMWLHRIHSREVFDELTSLTQVSMLPAKRRLQQVLGDLIEGLRTAGSNHRDRIALPLSYRELAGLVAVTPEHLSRLFNQLQADGIVRRDKGWLIVPDLNRLLASSGLT
jgi:CRP-like cAMP-binding protein